MLNKDRSFHESPEKAGADESADGTDADPVSEHSPPLV